MSKNQVFINQRQFTQLNEMGIGLWQSRDRNSTQITALNTKSTIKNIPLESLKNSLLFNNIISVMGISIGEVTQEHDHFNLGLFNWYFNSTESAENPSVIAYQENNLVTPTIETISTSAPLKKQLWLTLSQHVL